MKSIRCRLSNATWCEHFKSGECISPVKCKYQTEHMSVNVPETIFMPTKEAWEKMQAENSRLTAENTELRARLKKAVEIKPDTFVYRIIEGDFIESIPFTFLRIYEAQDLEKYHFFNTRAKAEARLKELQGGER